MQIKQTSRPVLAPFDPYKKYMFELLPGQLCAFCLSYVKRHIWVLVLIEQLHICSIVHNTDLDNIKC